MKVLIIDNNIDQDCWGSPDLVRYAKLLPGAVIHVRRGPHDDLPKGPEGFDRVIASGSRTSALDDAPWVHRFHELIRNTVEIGTPFLGVCFGHQSLVRALGGKETVRKAAQPEFGWTRIEITRPSTLMDGLPSVFHSFSAHFEEVGALPSGLRSIARSEDCAIQACQVEGKPAFGIQFHPEKNLLEGDKILREKEKLGVPGRLLNPKRGKELYKPEIGEILFKNFLRLSI